MLRTAPVLYPVVLISCMLLNSCDTLARQAELEILIIRRGNSEIMYQVEVARTRREMMRGLMYRDRLPVDQGMLFLYQPAGIANMWMKNTILSLDMIFIDEQGIIVKIVRNTVPYSRETISSDVPVRAVLELNAGQADRHQINPGDMVIHPEITR